MENTSFTIVNTYYAAIQAVHTAATYCTYYGSGHRIPRLNRTTPVRERKIGASQWIIKVRSSGASTHQLPIIFFNLRFLPWFSAAQNLHS